jgi:hypothetical protein
MAFETEKAEAPPSKIEKEAKIYFKKYHPSYGHLVISFTLALAQP